DLMLATHGRGVIIIDDITPLRELTQLNLDNDLAFLPSKATYIGSDTYGGAFPDGGYSGDNPDEDFTLIYYLKNRVTQGSVKLEVYDVENNLITTLPASKRKGINQASWNLRVKPPRVA